MRLFTVSELLTYQRCPVLWANQYFAKVRPESVGHDAPSFVRGSAVHLALDVFAHTIDKPISAKFAYETMSLMYMNLCEKEGWVPLKKHLDELDRMSYATAHYVNDLGIKTGPGEGSEITLEAPLGDGYGIMGKLDLLVSDDDGIWHRQFKSRAKSTDHEEFAREIQFSMHESAYRHLIEANFGKNYLGCDLVIIHGDALHKQKAGAECDHCEMKGYIFRPTQYIRHQLRIKDAVADRRQNDIDQVAQEILQVEKDLEKFRWDPTRSLPPLESRESACRNPYTRRLCGFHKNCLAGDGAGLAPPDYVSYDPNARYQEAHSTSQGVEA